MGVQSPKSTVGRTQTQVDGVAYRIDREISFSSLLVAMARGPSTGIENLFRKACSRMEEKTNTLEKHARHAVAHVWLAVVDLKYPPKDHK
jgi:hypothetical protein